VKNADPDRFFLEFLKDLPRTLVAAEGAAQLDYTVALITTRSLALTVPKDETSAIRPSALHFGSKTQRKEERSLGLLDPKTHSRWCAHRDCSPLANDGEREFPVKCVKRVSGS
jgi:hypothetical protein